MPALSLATCEVDDKSSINLGTRALNDFVDHPASTAHDLTRLITSSETKSLTTVFRSDEDSSIGTNMCCSPFQCSSIKASNGTRSPIQVKLQVSSAPAANLRTSGESS